MSLPNRDGAQGPFGIFRWPAYAILAAMAGRHRHDDSYPPGGRAPQVRGDAARGQVTSKVPEVNSYFWGVKILTTAMGEAVSDFLVKQYNPYLAVLMGFVVFAVAIVWQFRVPDYRTWPYWTAVAMVAVFGTMVADAMHVGLGIPYKVSATLFAVCLAVVFVVWYRVERTLSIHSITTPRREFFYWTTVCCTFAMGTAVGDLTAQTLHLGYFVSGVLFTLAIMVPLAAWRLGANPVLTFWVAYILTRPIGASFADAFGMPKASGGLGIGHGPVSVVTLIMVVAAIWYLSVTHKDEPSPVPAPGALPGAAPGAVPGRRAGWDQQAWAGREPQARRAGWDQQAWAGREPQARQEWEPAGVPQGREPGRGQSWEPGRGQSEWQDEPHRGARHGQAGWEPRDQPDWAPRD